MFIIYAKEGEFFENAGSIDDALAQFRERRPDSIVCAIVDDEMRPRLVLEQEEMSDEALASAVAGVRRELYASEDARRRARTRKS